jgi:hemoglobin-like flavoprotein
MSTHSNVKEPDVLNVFLLTTSFAKIEDRSDEFASTFYQILFDKYPQVRHLFSETDMAKQKKKLIESLQLVIANVQNPEVFSSILKMLGKRHVGYGAVLTDYPLIGDALLQSLEKHLGNDWNDEVKQTWTLAYQVIADTMAEGAKMAIPNPTARNIPSSEANLSGAPDSDPASIDRVETTSTISSKLLLLGITGVLLICGYGLWSMTQTQPDPNRSTPVQQPR